MKHLLIFVGFITLLVGSFDALSQSNEGDAASVFEEGIEQSRSSGDIDRAEEQTSLFLSTARKSNNEVWLARAFFESASNDIARNSYKEAQSKLGDAIVIFTRNNELKRLGRAHLQMSMTHFHLSEFAKSLEFDNKALQIFERLGDKYLLSNTYNNMGTTLQTIGEYEEAINIYERSLEIVESLNDEQGVATVLYNIGTLQNDIGKHANALKYFEDVLAIDTQYNDVANMASSYMNLASTLASMNDLESARKHILRSVDLYTQAQAIESIDRARLVRADIEIMAGNTKTAGNIIDGVIRRALDTYPNLLLRAYTAGATNSVAENDFINAEKYALKGLALTEESSLKPAEIKLYAILVDIYKNTGEFEKALNAIEQQKKLEDEVKDIAGARAAARVQVRTELVRRESRLALLEKERALNDAKVEQQQDKFMVIIIAASAASVFLILLVGRMMQSKTNKRLMKLVDKKTQELQVKNVELSDALRKIETESITDLLTGLHNRRYISKSIASDLQFSRRGYESWFLKREDLPSNADIIVFIIDIDNFKLLNDRYGHQSGDTVLVEFAKRISEVFRLSDYLVRWGGEEFVAIARFVNRDGAPMLADRLIEKINKEPFYINHDLTKRVTCSVGYSCYPVSLEVDKKASWEKLISLADAALYLAKHSGKNTWFGVHSLKATANIDTKFTEQELQRMIDLEQIELRRPVKSQVV